MLIISNGPLPEEEPQPVRFSHDDTTANYDPMAWNETSEDIYAGLEVENTYTTYGKNAFKPYKHYRRRGMR